MPENIHIPWPGWKAEKSIGKGGFGQVYKIVRDDAYGVKEEAALKVIPVPHDDAEVENLMAEGLDEETITQQMNGYVGDIVREYKVMIDLRDCPNIVRCDDYIVVKQEDSLSWLVYLKMELLMPLMKNLDKVSSEEQILRLAKDLCRALAVCQKLHILHRDIKPQNIFIDRHGNFKLGDFGIARSAERNTHATQGIGTYNYMAPEVMFSHSYNSSADIYSLGLVLYWLLNERRQPFLPLPPAVPTSSQQEQARSRRFRGEPLPAPKNGSDALKAIVLKACAHDPKQRYQTAEEMLIALEQMNASVPAAPAEKQPAAPVFPKEDDFFAGDETVLVKPMSISRFVEAEKAARDPQQEKKEKEERKQAAAKLMAVLTAIAAKKQKEEAAAVRESDFFAEEATVLIRPSAAQRLAAQKRADAEESTVYQRPQPPVPERKVPVSNTPQPKPPVSKQPVPDRTADYQKQRAASENANREWKAYQDSENWNNFEKSRKKKKLTGILIGVAVFFAIVFMCIKFSSNTTKTEPAKEASVPTAVEYSDWIAQVKPLNVKIWARSEYSDSADSWLPQILERFRETHPEYELTYTIENHSEEDVGVLVRENPEEAADLYFFASDQTGYLVEAGALNKLTGTYLGNASLCSSDNLMKSVTIPGQGSYGFPISTNTWVLYYNQNKYSAWGIKSLETMLSNGVVSFPLTDPWYSASFWMANGCTIFGEDGTDAAAGLNFSGNAGVAAANALIALSDNPNFRNDTDHSGREGLVNGTVDAYFGGSWEYDYLYEKMGDALAVATPPTVQINGTARTLEPFVGSKAIGVNPNAENLTGAMTLAAFLASEESQLLRYQLEGDIPAAATLLDHEEVRKEPAAAAEKLIVSSADSIQPNIPQMLHFWDPVKQFCTDILNNQVTRNNVSYSLETMNSEVNRRIANH